MTTPRARRVRTTLTLVCLALGLAAPLCAGTPEERLRAANEFAHGGDFPRAIAAYDSLAATGVASASLYWNWAQAASARGAMGEALWALLRAREIDPADRAVARDIDRLRDGANLDRAEIAPDPLATVARFARRFRLDLIALFLLVLSLGAHAGFKLNRSATRLVAIAWTALALGLAAAILPVAGAFARPLGVVVHRGAPMFDAASPTAEPIGTLREGEGVPILETSGRYVRIEDSSGARGWALVGDVRPITADPGR